MLQEDEDTTFASVHWDTSTSPTTPTTSANPTSSSTNQNQDSDDPPDPPSKDQYRVNAVESVIARSASNAGDAGKPNWEGRWVVVEVRYPLKELEGTKDMFVSYEMQTKTNLPSFTSPTTTVRRRFHDFVFLRDHLARDFPACVVPPLPGKHRLEYVTGDRFSTEFIEKRRIDLQRFLSRIARHPTLSRTSLFRAFLESTEWNVEMHTYNLPPATSAPSSPTSANATLERETPSLLDNISDTLLNAFAKVRKPDERFVKMKADIDAWEESMGGFERGEGKLRSRMGDLSSDYDDFAGSVQGLGFLESGITDALKQFELSLLDFSNTLKDSQSTTTEPLLSHLHSMLSYSTQFKQVLRLRDQKQLDFEELTAYLSGVTSERDRLANGFGNGLGLGGYIKDRLEGLRGDGYGGDGSREGRLGKLDGRIRELQDAVTTAHDVSERFNDETLTEHGIFQLAKRVEMKDMLGSLADGQIAMYKKAIEDWDACIPHIAKIRVDP